MRIVWHLIGHVVHIKTQITVLVMQAHSSKEQGGLQHQKLLHPLQQQILGQKPLTTALNAENQFLFSDEIKQ
jgi:hypothetical protein